MSSMIPIFDAGHGGLNDDSYYCIAGGRQVDYPEYTIYEGEVNRQIVARLKELCWYHQIPYVDFTAGYEDIPIYERARLINEHVGDRYDEYYVLSIHSNAGGGKGYEMFTYPTSKVSPPIAEMFAKAIIERFGKKVWRQDRPDELIKKRHFGILRMTSCPAMLFENRFMDNEVEARLYLRSKRMRDITAQTLFQAVYELYYHKKFCNQTIIS